MIKKNFYKRFKTSLILLLMMMLMFVSDIFSTYILMILSIFSIFEFLKISNKIILKTFYKYLSNIIFIIYICFYCYFFFYFSNYLYLKIILYILILGCISSDVGGFIFGNLFKGPKLTKISPKKTYSGSIGSIILTCFVTSILIFTITENFNYIILIISTLTSLGCQIGDLFFSYLKRKAKLKDTGNILPGHGGILDRIDGILLGVPVGFISLLLVN